jgi:hypothetical protein
MTRTACGTLDVDERAFLGLVDVFVCGLSFGVALGTFGLRRMVHQPTATRA